MNKLDTLNHRVVMALFQCFMRVLVRKTNMVLSRVLVMYSWYQYFRHYFVVHLELASSPGPLRGGERA